MKIQKINFAEETAPEKRNKKKKRVKRNLFWLKSLLIVILVGTTVVLLALSSLFNITSIEVNGSKHYTQSDITDVSGILKGNNGFKTIGSNIKNIFTLRYGKAEKSILKGHPYIKQVIARFVLPNKVKINIVERKPFSVVPFLASSLLVDKDGYILESIPNTKKKDLVIIKGIKIKQFELGQVLKTENSENYEIAVKLIEEINKSDQKDKFDIYSLIDSIDVGDLRNVKLSIDSRIIANIGDIIDISYKIDYLKQIFLNGIKKDEKGFLDFTAEERPLWKPENKTN